MFVDLSPAALIRSGSSLLFVLAGIYLLAIWPKASAARALAVLALAFGAQQVLFNALPLADARNADLVPFELVTAAAFLIVLVCAASFLAVHLGQMRDPPTPPPSPGAWPMVAGACVVFGVVALEATYWPLLLHPQQAADWSGGLWAITFHAAMASIGALMVAAAWAFRDADAVARRRLASIAAAFGFYLAWNAGRALPDVAGPDGATNALMVAVGALASLAWLAVPRAGGRRVPLLLFAGLIACGVMGYAETRILEAGGTDWFASAGWVRLAGLVVLGYAVVRADAMRQPLPRMHMATVAMAALAVLFVVAQLLQNILSAQLGLVYGGAVAGVFLFAVNPIQRFAEKHAEGGREAHAIETYRMAARLALRDRQLSKSEELELARLADRLRLTPSRALELLHEVSAELPERPARQPRKRTP